MRGQALYDLIHQFHYRITPADAGTSLIDQVGGKVHGDHPRGCGDKHTVRSMIDVVLGSPPRMRGQVSVGVVPGEDTGITPADAGTSEDAGTSNFF